MFFIFQWAAKQLYGSTRNQYPIISKSQKRYVVKLKPLYKVACRDTRRVIKIKIDPQLGQNIKTDTL